MSRLPTVGGDDNTWGNILNDFLGVEHNADGTLKNVARPSDLSSKADTATVNSELAAKADDSTVVHNTGNESIAGIKTFSSSPTIPTPTNTTDAANKEYVDTIWPVLYAADFGAIHTDGSNGAVNSVTLQAVVNAVPTSGNGQGGKIVLPAGLITMTTGLTLGGARIEFVGNGGISDSSTGFGTVLQTGTASMTLVDAEPVALSQQGIAFSDVALYDAAGGSILVKAAKVNRIRCENVTFYGDGSTTVGLYLAINGTDSSWHWLANTFFRNCAIGLELVSSFGGTMVGGAFLSNVGVSLDSSTCNWSFLGVKGDGGNPCYQDNGFANSYTNCHWETTNSGAAAMGWLLDGSGSSPSGDGRVLVGCTCTGAGGANNAGIQINVNATNTKIIAQRNSNLGSGKSFVDNGSKTIYDLAGLTPAFSKGATIVNSTGVSAQNIIVWRAPFPCTVLALKGWRTAGTGATVNAGKGTVGTPTNTILSSPLSLTSADTWIDGGSIQNTTFSAGDPLIITINSVAGSPTEVSVQIDFSRP